MKTIIKLARHIALTAFVAATLAGSAVNTRAEGGGVGSGGIPPPVLVVQTEEYCLYNNGMMVFYDGRVVWVR
jgi:hypothetical protein